ncbi:HlyD family secretion protein [Rubripirellula sp.]|nr:HlyD family secretion protein [Rubripirellula sp.]
MSEQIDLQELAITGDDAAVSFDAAERGHHQHPQSRRHRWFSRIVLPIGVVLGMLMLLVVSAGQQLLPSRNVTVVPVIMKRSASVPAGQVLFQAPGWIEPRPTPVNVPALAAGVVESLEVVDGQRLEAGQLIARLISIDAELAVRRAEATLALRKAEYQRSATEKEAAKQRFENPLHLHAKVADAESEYALAQSALSQLPSQISSAKATLEFAQKSLAAKQAAGQGVAGISKQRAEASLQEAEARLDELQNQQPILRSRSAAIKRKVTALEEQRRLLIDEKRQLAEAEANCQIAAALQDEAMVQLRQANLNLTRMNIAAPTAGRVLKLVASPGDRVMGIDATAEHRSSTIITMYDPTLLQVRVDVRLQDVQQVIPGQVVKVETAASQNAIDGFVLQTTSTANIQKNTLEVKVALVDPPASVTPEMLATATFLSANSATTQRLDEASAQCMYLPSHVLKNDQGGSFVWAVNANKRAVQKSVVIGRTTSDGFVEILSGLNPTDKVISGDTSDLVEQKIITIDWDTSQSRLVRN